MPTMASQLSHCHPSSHCHSLEELCQPACEQFSYYPCHTLVMMSPGNNYYGFLKKHSELSGYFCWQKWRFELRREQNGTGSGSKAPHSWSDEVKGPTKGGGPWSFLVQKLSNYAKRIHEPTRSMAWICCRSPTLFFHMCFAIRTTGPETCQIMQSQARLAPRVKAGNS